MAVENSNYLVLFLVVKLIEFVMPIIRNTVKELLKTFNINFENRGVVNLRSFTAGSIIKDN